MLLVYPRAKRCLSPPGINFELFGMTDSATPPATPEDAQDGKNYRDLAFTCLKLRESCAANKIVIETLLEREKDTDVFKMKVDVILGVLDLLKNTIQEIQGHADVGVIPKGVAFTSILQLPGSGEIPPLGNSNSCTGLTAEDPCGCFFCLFAKLSKQSTQQIGAKPGSHTCL